MGDPQASAAGQHEDAVPGLRDIAVEPPFEQAWCRPRRPPELERGVDQGGEREPASAAARSSPAISNGPRVARQRTSAEIWSKTEYETCACSAASRLVAWLGGVAGLFDHSAECLLDWSGYQFCPFSVQPNRAL